MQRILQLFSRALRLSLVAGLLCCIAATAQAQGGGEPINLNATLTYEFQPKFLKRLGFKRLAVGVGVSDIVRFSTVKYERGTSYPYCRTINLTFRPTF